MKMICFLECKWTDMTHIGVLSLNKLIEIVFKKKHTKEMSVLVIVYYWTRSQLIKSFLIACQSVVGSFASTMRCC